MSPFALDKTRREISRKVRLLRTERQFTQAELAHMLDISQSRLSEIEHGKGSFTAEQLLVIAKLFSVPLNQFGTPVSIGDELQNGLAMLGASGLVESTGVLPSDRLREVMAVVRETLVAADSPRHITALAPVLVNNIDNLNLWKLRMQLAEVGLDRRLGWLLQSIREALGHQLGRSLPQAVRRRYLKAQTQIDTFIETQTWQPFPFGDLLDRDIRSEKGLQAASTERSEIAKKWGIVTRLRTEDFVEALRAAHEPH